MPVPYVELSAARTAESRSTSKMIRAGNEPWNVRELLPVRGHRNELSYVALSRLRRPTCSAPVTIFDALHRACWRLSVAVA